MPKSKIIREFVDEEISLTQALRRLQVLAHDVGNRELETWVERELVGYGPSEDVPEYRRVTSLNFSYSGINNYTFQVKNTPLSPTFLEMETLEKVSEVAIVDNIESVQELAEGTSPVRIDRSFLAQEVEKRSEGAVQCYAIVQLVPTSFFKSIVAEDRNRIIKALTMLEDAYGNLDDMGLETTKQKASVENGRINEVVLNVKADSANDGPVGKKIAWNIIVPILTAVAGAVLGALAISYLGI